jgi:hypothetical protein
MKKRKSSDRFLLSCMYSLWCANRYVGRSYRLRILQLGRNSELTQKFPSGAGTLARKTSRHWEGSNDGLLLASGLVRHENAAEVF